MEEIVRFGMPLYDREFLRRMLIRCIAVTGFVILLQISAGNYDANYHRELLRESEVSRCSVRVTDVPDGFIRKEAAFHKIGKDDLLTGIKGIPDIADKMESVIISDRLEPVECIAPDMTEDVNPMAENDSAAEIKVIVYGNGGIPEMSEYICNRDAFSADIFDVPIREDMIFDGWYADKACSLPFEAAEGGQEVLYLYAGWRDVPGFITDSQGFILDERGYLVGCSGSPETVIDGLLCIPGYAECVGIEKGAFDTVKEFVSDIYISDNITYIAPGAFDNLEYLMYIEVLPGNPAYYSENGILYHMDGSVAACPAARLK